jgi:hypothetical protein
MTDTQNVVSDLEKRIVVLESHVQALMAVISKDDGLVSAQLLTDHE